MDGIAYSTDVVEAAQPII
ncbi:hypothetical protein SNEBB_008492, partial [Seison nebaliae]